MKIKPILIEKEDEHASTVLASSAVLIEEKYVIASSNILQQGNSDELLEKVESGKLYFYARKDVTNNKYRVCWENNGATFTSKAVNLLCLFKCKNLDEFCNSEFKDWSSSTNVNYITSIFPIFVVEGENASEENLKSILRIWLDNVLTLNVNKCDTVICVSTPFGSREFLNSISEGIISTTLRNSTLYLSDSSSAPGSEGGVVYLRENLNFPIGIIVSSLNWWKKEWVGFTLIADIRALLYQLVNFNIQMSLVQINTSSIILATLENCLVQINCGANWGTCILLSKENGIFITNAHVIRNGLTITLQHGNKVGKATLIFKSLDESVFDLAIVKSDENWSFLSPPNLNVTRYETGDTVYCAGYPLLSTVAKPQGISITRGIISASNPYMIKTTCGIYPGFSGGAVVNSDGVILGVIVCNTKLSDSGLIYPKYNMAIPLKAISEIIFRYLKTKDPKVLSPLNAPNPEVQAIWKLCGKL